MGLREIILMIVQVYEWLLIAAILMTWVPDVTRTAVGRFLHNVTEPYFAPFRKLIPPLRMGMGGIDFSPVVALIAYMFVRMGIVFILDFLRIY